MIPLPPFHIVRQSTGRQPGLLTFRQHVNVFREGDLAVVMVARECPICIKPAYVNVPAEGIEAYGAGALVQDAFPDLSADEREIFITGIHPWCWPISEDEITEDTLGWPWS